MTNKKIPMRQCVGCRQMKNKKELIRILKTEDEVLLDATGRKNGRGAYLCKNPECLRLAKKSRALERSLGIQIPAGVYEELEKEMSALAT